MLTIFRNFRGVSENFLQLSLVYAIHVVSLLIKVFFQFSHFIVVGKLILFVLFFKFLYIFLVLLLFILSTV